MHCLKIRAWWVNILTMGLSNSNIKSASFKKRLRLQIDFAAVNDDVYIDTACKVKLFVQSLFRLQWEHRCFVKIYYLKRVVNKKKVRTYTWCTSSCVQYNTRLAGAAKPCLTSTTRGCPRWRSANTWCLIKSRV